MKLYSEDELHGAIIAIKDGISIRQASKTWHISRTILCDRLHGGISYHKAARPQRLLSNY